MSLTDQLAAIAALKGQGKSPVEIAEAVGLELGDVESALSGALPTGVLPSVAGSAVGGLTVHKFAITHDMPGLENGIDIYTPKVGEVLYDAWFQITEVWNGTTPKGDIATAAWLALQEAGLFNAHQGAVDLTQQAEDYSGFQGGTGNGGSAAAAGVSLLQSAVLLGQGPPTPFTRTAPGVFTTTDPLQVIVSGDPTTVPGVATDATQGAATLYLLTAVPA